MRRKLSGMLILPLLALPAAASAQEEEQEESEGALPRLGQAPGEPLAPSASPSSAFGTPPAESKGNVLDFHGYMLLPLRIGVMERPDPRPGQAATTLHVPPLTPDERRSFGYTGVLPDPWIQLNFSYGNRTVAATAILGATGATDGTGFYNPVQQLGVYDAFISVNLEDAFELPFEVKVGALTSRYGAMGAYDAGRYGTPLMFRTNSVGETITASFDLGDAALVIEQGFGGQISRPEYNMVPAPWNDFAGTNSGSTNVTTGASFVNQLHGGIGFNNLVQLGLHYATAWSQDDQGPSGLIPDGRLSVYGLDARLTAGRFGHLYAGLAQTNATNAESVSGVIEILNARGGPELMDRYLGLDSGGDGSLTTFGAQYDMSLARAVYDRDFEGRSSDVLFSLFGMGTQVSSDDPEADGVLKLKGGIQATYNLYSWFSVSGRFDHVRLDSSSDRLAYHVISPALLFHTDWQSRDEFALQYSHYIYGALVNVRRGLPPIEDPTAVPDRNVLMLSGTFWW